MVFPGRFFRTLLYSLISQVHLQMELRKVNYWLEKELSGCKAELKGVDIEALVPMEENLKWRIAKVVMQRAQMEL